MPGSVSTVSAASPSASAPTARAHTSTAAGSPAAARRSASAGAELAADRAGIGGGDPGRRRQGLQAAAVAAVAGRSAGHHHQVADLAGLAAGPVVARCRRAPHRRRSRCRWPGSTPSATPPAGSPARLGQRTVADVVTQRHVESGALADQRGERDVAPPEIGRPAGHPGRGRRRCRHPRRPTARTPGSAANSAARSTIPATTAAGPSLDAGRHPHARACTVPSAATRPALIEVPPTSSAATSPSAAAAIPGSAVTRSPADRPSRWSRRGLLRPRARSRRYWTRARTASLGQSHPAGSAKMDGVTTPLYPHSWMFAGGRHHQDRPAWPELRRCSTSDPQAIGVIELARSHAVRLGSATELGLDELAIEDLGSDSERGPARPGRRRGGDPDPDRCSWTRLAAT